MKFNQSVTLLVVCLAGILLVGCATIGGAIEGVGKAVKSTGTTNWATLHVKCDVQQQKECVEFRALNFAWKETQAGDGGLLKGLDKPSASEKEREDRAWELGNRLWKGARDGSIDSGSPRSFIVYLYGLKNPDKESMATWAVNMDSDAAFKHRVRKLPGVDQLIPRAKVPQFDKRYDLGQPDMIIRIRAEGARSVGTSFQMPWSMVGDNTHMLICAEDEAVYPPAVADSKHGLWLLPSQLSHFKSTKSTRVLLPFVFRDQGAAATKK